MTPVERSEIERLAKKTRNIAIAHRLLAEEYRRAGFPEDSVRMDLEARNYDRQAARLEHRLRRRKFSAQSIGQTS